MANVFGLIRTIARLSQLHRRSDALRQARPSPLIAHVDLQECYAHEWRRRLAIPAGTVVDVYASRWQCSRRPSAHETFGVGVVGDIKRLLAKSSDLRYLSEKYVAGREQRLPLMVVVIIVPGEELMKPAASVRQRREPIRRVGLVLRGLEVTFREGIVVAHPWSAQLLSNFQGEAVSADVGTSGIRRSARCRRNRLRRSLLQAVFK